MKKNKINSIIIGLLIFLPILLAILPINQVQAAYSDAIQANMKYNWKIENVTDEVVTFTDVSYIPKGNWKAYTGNYISYSVTSVAEEITGSFSIGNLTVTATDADIAVSLTLSIGTWYPGLISDTNWTQQSQYATNNATGFFDGDLTYTLGSQTATFKYLQNTSNGNQNTTLIYNRTTGILLEGYGEYYFGSHVYIGLSFDSAEVITPPIGIESMFLTIIGIFITASIIAIYFNNTRKKNIIQG